MHPPAYDFVAEYKSDDDLRIIDVGSRDINGTCRPLFPNAHYLGLDLYAGPGVDIVCNATEYVPDESVDMVLCAECLEHAPDWREIIAAAYSWLAPGGTFVMTCAAPGRDAHSHIDGQLLRPGEYYANLSGKQIADCLRECGFREILTRQSTYDTYAAAIR